MRVAVVVSSVHFFDCLEYLVVIDEVSVDSRSSRHA